MVPRQVRRPRRPPSDVLAPHDWIPQNRLLSSLPDAARSRLTPYLESVTLQKNDVLFRNRDPLSVVYFPQTTVVSLVSTLESGQSLEVGLVGRDGLAGTAIFPGITTMPCDGVVQIPGRAQRLSADVLRREVLVDEILCSTVARFAQVLLIRCMQMSICNMFHSVEQRCIRWLLSVDDLISNGEVPLTHDLMATMLGVHRPTVTLVLRSLREKNLVDERRGLVRIQDRSRLEEVCCECYVAMRDEQRRLLGY